MEVVVYDGATYVFLDDGEVCRCGACEKEYGSLECEGCLLYEGSISWVIEEEDDYG